MWEACSLIIILYAKAFRCACLLSLCVSFFRLGRRISTVGVSSIVRQVEAFRGGSNLLGLVVFIIFYYFLVMALFTIYALCVFPIYCCWFFFYACLILRSKLSLKGTARSPKSYIKKMSLFPCLTELGRILLLDLPRAWGYLSGYSLFSKKLKPGAPFFKRLTTHLTTVTLLHLPLSFAEHAFSVGRAIWELCQSGVWRRKNLRAWPRVLMHHVRGVLALHYSNYILDLVSRLP